MPQVFQHLPKGQATSPKPTSSTVTGRFQSVVGLQRQGRDQKQYSAALRKRLVGDSTMGSKLYSGIHVPHLHERLSGLPGALELAVESGHWAWRAVDGS